MKKIGFEYSFSEIPFNIGIDWNLTFNFVEYSGFWADGVAITFRNIFYKSIKATHYD